MEPSDEQPRPSAISFISEDKNENQVSFSGRGGDTMKTVTEKICRLCKWETGCIIAAVFEKYPGAHNVVFEDGCPIDIDREALKDVKRQAREDAEQGRV